MVRVEVENVSQISNRTGLDNVHLSFADIPDAHRGRSGRFRWKSKGNSNEENLQWGIQNIRAVFIQAHPEFLEFLYKSEDGPITVVQDKRQEAAEYILERISSRQDYEDLFGLTSTMRGNISYFEGSYQNALQLAFSPWDIPIRSNFKVKPVGYWTEEQIKSEVLDFIKSEGKFSSQILSKAGRNDLCLAISRKYPGGMRKLREDLNLEETGKPVGYWSNERILTEATTVFEKDGLLTAQHLESTGRLDLLHAIYRYYGNLSQLKKDLGIPKKTKIDYWSEEKVFQEASDFLAIHGEFSMNLLRKNKRGDIANAIHRHYPGGVAQLQLDLGLSGYRKYWTEERIEKEAQDFFIEFGNISYPLLRGNGKTKLAAAIAGRYKPGFAALKQKLGIDAKALRPRGTWTEEVIKEEARKFYEEFGEISWPVLKRAGRQDLMSAIHKNYPGGSRALRDDLGLRVLKRRNGHWTQDQIEKEAALFYEKFGTLSQNFLKEKGKGSLSAAISVRYPGGLIALQKKMGIEPKMKEKRYWYDPKNVENEAKKAVALGSNLSHKSLVKLGMSTLSQALYKLGLRDYLKEKFGIENQFRYEKTKLNLEQAQEDLWKLLEVVK